MRDYKLYNVLFPIWLLIFLTPWLFVSLIGNLLIDGTIIYLTLRLNHALPNPGKLGYLIFVSWVLGFVVDIIAALILLRLTMSDKLEDFYIWDYPKTIMIYMLIIISAGCLIYLVNRFLCRKFGFSLHVSHKVARAMGIITAPWLFLVPPSLIY